VSYKDDSLPKAAPGWQMKLMIKPKYKIFSIAQQRSVKLELSLISEVMVMLYVFGFCEFT
jgi:hypothetical protein